MKAAAPSGAALSVPAPAPQSRRITSKCPCGDASLKAVMRSRLVRVGTGLTVQTHILKVSVLRRNDDGRGTTRLRLVRIGAGLTEQAHNLEVSVKDASLMAVPRSAASLSLSAPAEEIPGRTRRADERGRPWVIAA
jgi:hypothetical protein